MRRDIAVRCHEMGNNVSGVNARISSVAVLESHNVVVICRSNKLFFENSVNGVV